MASNNIVHLPTSQDIEEAKRSSRTLSKYADAERVQLSIKGSNDQQDEFVLPGHEDRGQGASLLYNISSCPYYSPHALPDKNFKFEKKHKKCS